MTRAETIDKFKRWLDSAETLQIGNSEYAEILKDALYYLQEDDQTIHRLKVTTKYLLMQRRRWKKWFSNMRDHFIDYVCSGVPNRAPYCQSACDQCVDGRGWCIDEACTGFFPKGDE